MRNLHRASGRSGFSVFELMVVFTVGVVVLGAILGGLAREARHLANSATSAAIGMHAHAVVDRIDEDLRQARGCLPLTMLAGDHGPGETRLSLVDSRGFPHLGHAVIDPFDDDAERAIYSALDGSAHDLEGAERGALGSASSGHPAGTPVLGGGVALAVAGGVGTRQAQSREGPIEFVGDGTGFSYRVPVDPASTGSLITNTGVRWGGPVEGLDRASGRIALRFRAERVLREADIGRDVNGDGDRNDAFEIGRIVRCCWDAESADARGVEFTISPAFVVQPLDDPGGDIDGDGFADPIFLWDTERDLLHLRLFVLERNANGSERVVPVERRINLENRAELPAQ